MGIRFLCPNGHKLNVKSFLAGKRGICPECDARFVIPLASGGAAQPIEENAAEVPEATTQAKREPPPTSEAEPSPTGALPEVWHLRTAAGAQQGPISRSQLQDLITAGKVDSDAWLWKSGWVDWQRASDVFPQFGIGSVATATEVIVSAPAAQTPPVVAEAPFPASVPHESDAVVSYRRLHRQRKERARSITLALIALICMLSCVLVFVLWNQS